MRSLSQFRAPLLRWHVLAPTIDASFFQKKATPCEAHAHKDILQVMTTITTQRTACTDAVLATATSTPVRNGSAMAPGRAMGGSWRVRRAQGMTVTASSPGIYRQHRLCAAFAAPVVGTTPLNTVSVNQSLPRHWRQAPRGVDNASIRHA